MKIININMLHREDKCMGAYNFGYLFMSMWVINIQHC